MAGIQVDQFSMEKEETTDVEYLDGAVEHVRKASGTRPDLANWPSGPLMVQKSIVPAYSMRFKIQSLDCFCRANGRSRKRTQTRLCALTFLAAVKKEGKMLRI